MVAENISKVKKSSSSTFPWSISFFLLSFLSPFLLLSARRVRIHRHSPIDGCGTEHSFREAARVMREVLFVSTYCSDILDKESEKEENWFEQILIEEMKEF